MKVKRKIIHIDDELCDGCGLCVPSCAEGAIEVRDGKARVVAEMYCDGLGACLGECPTGALTIVEREADDFDEAAVEAYLKEKQHTEKPPEDIPVAGCPSARLQTFIPASASGEPNGRQATTSSVSGLSHWPVQINLVPPTAPFLKDADLLVVADCVPVAFPRLHADFLPEKAVLMGCPKFDDVEAYVKKFVDIFRTANVRSVTILSMEVPCCSGLPMIVKKAMTGAEKKIPSEEVVISTRGEILKREKLAA
jgi:NAD-dependent dihydropyrimidine dehydrogenase PreA subunit